MTKRKIRNWFLGAISTFIILLIAGIIISILDCSSERKLFSTYKDLIPLFLGIAAAWLGYCIQKRNSYQQQLRSLWSKLIESVHYAIQYTCINNPNKQQHQLVLLKLSITIDEIRGVFCNLQESNTNRGLYPFEPLKDIYSIIENLGHGNKVTHRKSIKCNDQIYALWKDVRKEILKEFDREIPTFSHSHWADLSKQRVYDKHKIPKKAT